MNIASSDLVMRSTRLSYSEALLKYDGRSDAEARWLDFRVPTTLLLGSTSVLNVGPWRDYGTRDAVCQELSQGMSLGPSSWVGRHSYSGKPPKEEAVDPPVPSFAPYFCIRGGQT
jgi:hypothetical protein